MEREGSADGLVYVARLQSLVHYIYYDTCVCVCVCVCVQAAEGEELLNGAREELKSELNLFHALSLSLSLTLSLSLSLSLSHASSCSEG